MKKSGLYVLIGVGLGVVGSHVAARFGDSLPPAPTSPASPSTPAPTAQPFELGRRNAVAALEQAVDDGVAGPALDSIVAAAANTDVDAVVRLLAALQRSPRAEGVAASLLMALGAGPDALEHVVRVLSGSGQDASGWRVRLIAALAETEPLAAAGLADSLSDPAERSRAQTRVAAVWATADPLAAIAHLETLGDSRRRDELLRAAFTAWSLTDPRAALMQYERLRTAGMSTGVGDLIAFELLARQDPEALLNLLPIAASPLLADNGMRVALSKLAERDPEAALDYAERLAAGSPQSRLAAVAEGWARRDVSAALAWARSQGAEAPSLEAAIYAAAAETEPMRALDLALAMSASADARAAAVQAVVDRALTVNPALTERMAEAALALSEPALRRQALERVITRWQFEAPEAAIEWLASNAERVPDTAFQQLTTSFRVMGGASLPIGGLDAATAASYAQRVPESVRAEWIRAVGYAYAREDPLASIDWIESLRNEPEYATGLATVAMGVAQSDPLAALDLVERAGLDPANAAAILPSIAEEWALQRPRAAADWARTLPDAEVRASTQERIVRAWASKQPDAARDFVLAMPTGPDRDAALRSLLSSGVHDAAVLDAFGSDRARDAALTTRVTTFAFRDRAAARELLQQITDPAMRRTAERSLEIASRASPGVVISGGRMISLPRVAAPE